MKTTKKALLLALCAVLLVVSTVFITMAYLTSTTDVVKNTFTIGEVEITLDEAEVDEYGENPNGRTDEGNEYKLVPGHTYIKDPTVTVNAGSEDCYVFAKVTITDFATLQAACGDNTLLPQDFIGGWDASVWECTEYTLDAETGDAVCLFTYTEVVEYNKDANTVLPALFETITLPETVTDLEGLDKVQIDVVAYAVQADGFTSAEAAWNAAPATW